MLDPNLLRNDLDGVVAGLARRGFAFDREAFARVDGERRRVIQEAEALKAERNRVSDEVAQLKRAKQDAAHLIEAQKSVGERLKALEAAEREAEAAFRAFLAEVPNLPHPSVPDGRDEHGNVEVKRWGTAPVIPSPKDHVELGTKLGILDLDRAAKLSGARFAVLKGLGAKLERALASFMLDLQTKAGWSEVLPPYLVNAESMTGTGQLPKFEADLFKVPRQGSLEIKTASDDPLLFHAEWTGGSSFAVQVIAKNKSFGCVLWTQNLTSFECAEDVREIISKAYLSCGINDSSNTEGAIRVLFVQLGKHLETIKDCSLYLIPTAEVPVTNLYRDEILGAEQLPLRHCAFTPCFRSEAGSYGKDTKGIIRQHQFHKVELVAFAAPEQAEAELEHLTACAEAVLEALGLPYRRMLLCTGDMGFSSQKTYDLEVWLPSQNTYREISSCSWFGDFQARRAAIRFKGAEPKARPQLLHTLNGSGLAVGRTWVAILENGQQPDGSVRIPQALVPYLGTDVLR